MRPALRPLLGLALLMLSMLACAVPGFEGEPTPPPAPTPSGDMIFFTAPYIVPLQPGTYIPGTQIGYVQSSGELHELVIDNLRSYRQAGDSITWSGIIAPGIHGAYRLHLQGSFTGALQAEGEVRVSILNPIAVEIPPTTTPLGSVVFNGIPVNYVVPEGSRIPGTSLIYVGERNGVAELSGTASYPFFAVEDSLIWVGKLREEVTVRYNLRVNRMDQYGLHLAGTAELWVMN